MNRRVSIIGFALIVAVGLMTAGVRSQDGPGEKGEKKEMKSGETGGMPGQPSPAEMAEMMKKYMETIKPGPSHKRLDCLVGEWKGTVKSWMGGPGTPPSESKGHARSRWVLDGRFVVEEFESEMMMPNEKGEMSPIRFHGMGMIGYDNYRKMYVQSWVDTLGTQMLTMHGMMDPSGKRLTLYGEMDEPGMGVVGRTVKYVTEIADKDHHVLKIYDLHAGDDYKVMEVSYTRE